MDLEEEVITASVSILLMIAGIRTDAVEGFWVDLGGCGGDKWVLSTAFERIVFFGGMILW